MEEKQTLVTLHRYPQMRAPDLCSVCFNGATVLLPVCSFIRITSDRYCAKNITPWKFALLIVALRLHQRPICYCAKSNFYALKSAPLIIALPLHLVQYSAFTRIRPIFALVNFTILIRRLLNLSGIEYSDCHDHVYVFLKCNYPSHRIEVQDVYICTGIYKHDARTHLLLLR